MTSPPNPNEFFAWLDTPDDLPERCREIISGGDRRISALWALARYLADKAAARQVEGTEPSDEDDLDSFIREQAAAKDPHMASLFLAAQDRYEIARWLQRLSIRSDVHPDDFMRQADLLLKEVLAARGDGIPAADAPGDGEEATRD